MPFRSKAQWRLMFLKHPEIARRWARETKTSYKKLPKKKRKKIDKSLIEELEKALS